MKIPQFQIKASDGMSGRDFRESVRIPISYFLPAGNSAFNNLGTWEPSRQMKLFTSNHKSFQVILYCVNILCNHL